jgi:hypothetical protein
MTLRPSRHYRREGDRMSGRCLRCGCRPDPVNKKVNGKRSPGRPLYRGGRCKRCFDDRARRDIGRKRSGNKAKYKVDPDVPF